MLRSKFTNFFIHAAGWLVFLGFPLLFMNRTQDDSSSTYFIVFSPYYWLFCLTYIVLFYLNAWYLVPQFVFKKRYLYYGVIVLGLIVCVYFLRPFDNLLAHNLRPSPKPKMMLGASPLDSLAPDGKSLPFGPLPHQDMRMQDPHLNDRHSLDVDMVGMFLFIMIMGLSTAISTVERWQLSEQKIVKAEAEKAQAELSFLKAQINPHFLFNTLNNIYALAVTEDKNTPASIMKLSNIMRYVTDEVTENVVSLQSEVDCINNYIDLQRLRLGKKTTLSFDVTGKITDQKIAPLVLMTFIENVFKYGVSKHEASRIDLKLDVDGNKLKFFCRNHIFDNASADNRQGGIGISNTRQRLNHLYPNRHKLDIVKENNLFTVNLEIDC